MFLWYLGGSFFGEIPSGSYSRTGVLFCSLAVLDPRVGHTMDVLSPFISILNAFTVILIDSSMESPVKVTGGNQDSLA